MFQKVNRTVHASRTGIAVLFVAVVLLSGTALAGTAAATSGDANDTSGALADAIDEPTGAVNETANETVNETTETANETTGTVNETVDGTIGTVNETTGAVGETVSYVGMEAADGLDGNVSTALGDVTEGTPVAPLGEAAGELVESVERTAASVGTIVTGQVSDLYEGLDGAASTLGVLLEDRSDAGTATSITLAYLVGIGANSMAASGTATTLSLQSSLSSMTGRRTSSAYDRSIGDRLWSALIEGPWEFLASVFRYSRYDDSDPLEHDRRRTVYDEIVENPGIYLSEVETSTDIPLSTARHHLRILEEENLVRSETIRSKRRYFAVDVAKDQRRAAGLDATKRRILDCLAREPATNTCLANELDLDPSTITHHLSILEDEGLVVREREGRSIVNRIAPTAGDVLGANPPAVNG